MARIFRNELERKAVRVILAQSFYRWESAAIIGLTIILFVLVPQPLPFWQRWFWIILGALGEIGLIWSSVQDPEFRAQAISQMFREKYKTREIKNRALRSRVEKALEYRDRIDQVITKSRESVLRDHMADVSQGITSWLENVFRLAKRLDAYMADEMISQDLRSIDPAIENLKKRLAQEDDDAVRDQIGQAIAQKQIQRDNLLKLENVMERADFQLESTVTAMGTVYSQMMLLSARDVASGRAQRLQQDIADQVQALQDIVQTVDEVYRTGGFDMSSEMANRKAVQASHSNASTVHGGTARN
ncbi:MAG: hypothetical protein ACUVWZ_07340 [Anaerolineae bacterium]